jgi:SpoVK/Ycf46/Vps4 family AAA+-type ATPase
LVILTTNLPENLDSAFERRLLFTLDFPLPDVPQREELWRRRLSRVARLAPDVDAGALAREFHLAGGNIRKAVRRALGRAFRREGGVGELRQKDLVEAAREQLATREPVVGFGRGAGAQ